MRLRKLTLNRFRLHEHSVLDLSDDSRFVVVRGENAAGKTSLGQGLSINLSETTMGLQADGTGYRDKISDGKKESEVIVEIQGQHILEKTVTMSLGSAGRTQTIKCIDAPEDKKIIAGFENFLTRYRDALKVVLNTEHFIQMDDKSQRALLAKLVLPSRYDFPKDKVEAVNGLLDTAIDFNGEPFSVIELAYKKLYKERENCNRDVKNFVIPEALPIPKGVDSESLQKELTDIRAQREKTQKERDAAVAKANEVEVQRATLQTKIEGLRAKLDEGKKKLTSLELSILTDADKAALASTAAQGDELAKLRKEHSAYHGGLVLVNEQIDKLRSLMDKGSECPVCEQPIDGEKISNIIEGLKKEIDSTDAELQKLDTKIEAIGDVDKAKESLKKHEQAVKEKEELTKSLVDVVAEGKKTKADLEALGEKKDATLPFHNPLETLQAKEDNIVAQLRPVIAAEERASEIKTKTEQLGKLQEKAKTLQDLVVYFDKDGVKAKLITDHIGSFQSKMDAVLNRFKYKAELGPDMEFKVTTKRGYSGPIKELSKAERHMFMPAFQCAVSIAAGIKLVVIDDMDDFLRETGMRNEMYASVYGLVADGSLEQVIAIEASTDRTVPPAERRAKGSAYFYVEDGQVERLR